MKISDYRGNQIKLTNERWQHIITEHLEVRRFKNRLLEILKLGLIAEEAPRQVLGKS